MPPAKADAKPEVADTLHGKIAEVQATIGVMEKDRHVDVRGNDGNIQYSYDYLSESTLMSAVRRELAQRGVAVYVSCTRQWREGMLTFVETAMTFADGATGEVFTVTGQGQGTDKSDKGVYKAYTGAVRYMLWKTFLVPTEGDDPNQPHTVIADRTDSPVTITEVLDRLANFVEVGQPWVAEAIVAYYSDVDKMPPKWSDLPTKVQLNAISNLQKVLLDLEDDREAFTKMYADSNIDGQQSRVRAAFAKGFEGVEVKGPDPFKPAIPF